MQHEEFNEMISNQGHESTGQSNRLERKQRSLIMLELS